MAMTKITEMSAIKAGVVTMVDLARRQYTYS